MKQKNLILEPMTEEELQKMAAETDKTYVKDDGVFYIKLSDGRLWCPSLQARGTRYNYTEPSLKKLQNQKYRRDDFVAIDFELAYDNKKEGHRFPCQLGIAVVRDGKIIQSLSYLIKPPHNTWSPHDIMWHRENTCLTPNDTCDALEFNELWPEIKDFFNNQFIIAHNAKAVEMDILEKCLDYYGIPYPSMQGYLCTMELLKEGNNSTKLNDLCERYYIDFNEDIHHDAEQDAIACAKLFLAKLNGVNPINAVEFQNKRNMPPKIQFDFGDDSESKTSKSAIKELPQNIVCQKFAGKTIVLTGDFTLVINEEPVDFSRNERIEVLKPWIESMGAKVTSSISGKTDIVIQGANPGKQDKIDEQIAKGHDIEVLSVDFLNDLLKSSAEQAISIDENNPLFKRKFALIGNFSSQQETFIKWELGKRGAILNQKKEGKYPITRTTHYCILFDGASEEDLYKIDDFVYDGYHIIKVPFSDFEKLLQPNLGDLFKEQIIKRDLKITKEFLKRPRFQLKVTGYKLNPYSGQEIYRGKGFSGDVNVLDQIIGNLGAYANPIFYPETQILLLSDLSVNHLKNNEYDETIDYIQNVYNKEGESLGFFNYAIVSESEYLNWVESWIKNFDINDSTYKLYHLYRQPQ